MGGICKDLRIRPGVIGRDAPQLSHMSSCRCGKLIKYLEQNCGLDSAQHIGNMGRNSEANNSRTSSSRFPSQLTSDISTCVLVSLTKSLLALKSSAVTES